jgi:hypothetical protein
VRGGDGVDVAGEVKIDVIGGRERRADARPPGDARDVPNVRLYGAPSPIHSKRNSFFMILFVPFDSFFVQIGMNGGFIKLKNVSK